MSTIGANTVGLSLHARSSGGSKSFLSATNVSPVQQMLDKQHTARVTKQNYFESEDYLRMKATEISRRIALYKNLGLSAEYQMAQQEGVEVVKKYQALLQRKPAPTTETEA